MRAVITGTTSGLGAELARQLLAIGAEVWGLNERHAEDVTHPYGLFHCINRCDITKADDVKLFTKLIPEPVDVLINNAGVNEINYIEELEEKEWDMVMDTNAKGIYLVTKAILPKLTKGHGTIINIVSNAAHIPMTASLAYNASKGAAHIMTLQMARELTKRHGITVFGVAPNKMAGTEMSAYIERRVQKVRGWTAEQAKAYQLAALPAGEETDPRCVAEFIVWLLGDKRRHKYLTGTVIPYGA